jgi:sigma-E factor negative regulatory protein RseA
MVNTMKDRISALMDGELSQADVDAQLKALREDGEALETWRRYHLISDSLRDSAVLSSGFSARFAERLAKEPTILAPASIPARAQKSRMWIPVSAMAASLAAVAFVGSMSFQFFNAEAPQVAQVKPVERSKPAAPTVVPMPGAVNDYLLAHQNYSPRSSLQGVAPYVRTVSDSARAR